jgi:hypothetical protein
MSEALFYEEWYRADKHISEGTFVLQWEVGGVVVRSAHRESGDVMQFKNLFIGNWSVEYVVW